MHGFELLYPSRKAVSNCLPDDEPQEHQASLPPHLSQRSFGIPLYMSRAVQGQGLLNPLKIRPCSVDPRRL